MDGSAQPRITTVPRGQRIGPNAITRLGEALASAVGDDGCARVFRRAGLAAYLEHPPEDMVDERAVTRLHQAAYALLGAAPARRIGRDAGRRTALYLLQKRIPRPVRMLLRALPARAASHVLVAAIGRHSWTFAGSALFTAQAGRPTVFTLTDCPLCRASGDSGAAGGHAALVGEAGSEAGSEAGCGAGSAGPRCDFYAGCFEELFRTLVHRHARVRETRCAAAGAASCRFEVCW